MSQQGVEDHCDEGRKLLKGAVIPGKLADSQGHLYGPFRESFRPHVELVLRSNSGLLETFAPLVADRGSFRKYFWSKSKKIGHGVQEYCPIFAALFGKSSPC